MQIGRKEAALAALYLAAGAILVALLLDEFRRDRFEDCMSIGAFTKAQCEDYARE